MIENVDRNGRVHDWWFKMPIAMVEFTIGDWKCRSLWSRLTTGNQEWRFLWSKNRSNIEANDRSGRNWWSKDWWSKRNNKGEIIHFILHEVESILSHPYFLVYKEPCILRFPLTLCGVDFLQQTLRKSQQIFKIPLLFTNGIVLYCNIYCYCINNLKMVH